MSDSNPFFDSFSNDESDVVVNPQQEIVMSNPFSDNNVQQSNTNYHQKENKKYYIRDNYWFINIKLYKKEKLDDNEVMCLTLSFNAQYDNLRIVFLSPQPDAFNSNSIIRSKCKILTSANIFAETCEALLYYYDRSENKIISHHSLERLIQGNTDWKPNNTKFDLDKKNNRITIYTSPVNNNRPIIYKFTFDEYQTEGFLNVCKFMRKEAWIISNLSQFFINN